jgi:hypothetical protein
MEESETSQYGVTCLFLFSIVCLSLQNKSERKKYMSLSSAFSFIQQLVSDCIYILLPSLFGM